MAEEPLFRDPSKGFSDLGPAENRLPKPLATKTKKGIFPKALGIAAVGAAAFSAGYLERQREGLDKNPYDVRQEYNTAREKRRSKYETTGELPSIAIWVEFILAHDLVAYMGSEAPPLKISGIELRNQYHELADEILREALGEKEKPESELKGLPKSHALEVLLRLKSAFQKHVGTTYNRDSDSLVDAIVNHKYQCRSGALSLILLAMEASQRENIFSDGETLVEIYTDGHVEPGLLLKDRTLIGIEMTSAGNGVRNFGNMDKIKEPIRVVLADHAAYQDALGAETLKGTILHDTVPEGTPAPQTPNKQQGKFGFGVPKVPEGDLSMATANFLPAEMAFDQGDLSRRMEKIESDADILNAITNLTEREYVRTYFIHHRIIDKYYNQHLEILDAMKKKIKKQNLPEEEIANAAKEINRLANSLEQYVKANDLDNHCQTAEDILNKYKRELIVRALPSETVQILRNNAKNLRKILEEAKENK